MARVFLSARWVNLVLANYAVPPELLAPRLPPGLALDLRDGQAWASLVAFQFLDTRVLGVAWPGYRHFAELNLRFYVRDGQRRGVCFVRELVPQKLTAALARLLYNEPYRAAPLTARISQSADELRATYELAYAGRTHVIQATGALPSVKPPPESAEHFFKEHEWGFGTSRAGKRLTYRVEHPVWDVLPVTSHRIDLDWGAVYGPEWAVLQTARPASVVLAAGSAILVRGLE